MIRDRAAIEVPWSIHPVNPSVPPTDLVEEGCPMGGPQDMARVVWGYAEGCHEQEDYGIGKMVRSSTASQLRTASQESMVPSWAQAQMDSAVVRSRRQKTSPDI